MLRRIAALPADKMQPATPALCASLVELFKGAALKSALPSTLHHNI
jgi:hypothetical protein